MAKKLDEATRLLIDSLPENLQKLATSAVEVGYLSQMDFNAATEADEVPADCLFLQRIYKGRIDSGVCR